MEHIAIIGNGISGVTLARHIRKLSDKKITIISAETDYFFSRTALMYVFMRHLKFEHTQPYEADFWKKNKIELKKAFVNRVDTENKSLFFSDNSTLKYDKLVIATGSKPNKFGWKGQDSNGVFSLYSKQDLEKTEQLALNCKRAVVVGGGLIGIELVEMLLSRNIPVTYLVREKSFWSGVLPSGESEMISKHIVEHHVDLRLDTNLEEIIADELGNTKAIVTDKGETIDCMMVGITVGVSPNIDFLKGSTIDINRGVKVNRFLETNIKDVYAIGDCAEQHEAIGNRKTIEAVWYTGRMMGETLAQTLCGNPMQYNPGHWFNSAKFLDIEYQTYGWVFSKPLENEEQFYWEHSANKKAIRISFDKETKVFLGINTFGIRMRHDFFDKILTEKKSVYYVMEHLKEANFDPEFFKPHEKEIQVQFNLQFKNLETV
ncbi:FAD/NAD(P)-binding oxidoreductase [Flavobacterium sp.]|uniref:NAD(P)/FAD-dependent oxidoreductase n=1 Tax=Flavobacterium sp. TaxID=239 RepID=UPI00286E53B6|nr:FAD/NAD(P)-binding oxidoreductase [Flavobacterium sp.]